MTEVTEDQLDHRIKQLAIFLPNRLGALLSVTRALEGADIRICAVTILDSADHAVARLVVDQPTLATSILTKQGYSMVESDLLGVGLPEGSGIREVLASVIRAELNVHYLYALMTPARGRPVLAIHVEDAHAAARTLFEHGLSLIDQSDLRQL